MSWAETKKINSDMETPLDVLFKSLFRVKESEEVLFNAGTGTGKTTTGESTIITKTMNMSGTVKIKAEMDRSVIVSVYVNNEHIKNLAVTTDGTMAETVVNVKKGDVLKLTNKGVAQSNKYYRDLSICGTVGFAVPVIS